MCGASWTTCARRSWTSGSCPRCAGSPPPWPTGPVGSLRVDVDAPTGPVRLPERVEVAGYRIVTEAVTNVVRHAQATHCQVGVRIGPDLCVQVRDDGRGVPAGATAGIGRESMLRRATDLGGSCTITPAAGGGTLVSVLLPLREPGAGHD